MARHIKRAHEFNYNNDLENILNKFKKSGYFSKNDQVLLNKIGGPNFFNLLIDKIDGIIDFFNRYDGIDVENILMDIFDERFYSMQSTCEISTSPKCIFSGRPPLFNIEHNTLLSLDDEYWKTDEKDIYLISKLLPKLKNVKTSYSLYQSDNNKLSLIFEIQPQVSVSINLKEFFNTNKWEIWNQYYRYEDFLSIFTLNGITYNEYNHNNIKKNIEKRLSRFIDVESRAKTISSNFTPLKFILNNDIEETQTEWGLVTQEKQNRILTSSRIEIYFDI